MDNYNNKIFLFIIEYKYEKTNFLFIIEPRAVTPYLSHVIPGVTREKYLKWPKM